MSGRRLMLWLTVASAGVAVIGGAVVARFALEPVDLPVPAPPCPVVPEAPPEEPTLAQSGDRQSVISALSRVVRRIDRPDAVVEAQRSLAAIEARSLGGYERCGKVPFGLAYGGWLSFRSKVRDGDIVVYYRPGQLVANEVWVGSSEGYAIIRGNALVARFETAVE